MTYIPRPAGIVFEAMGIVNDTDSTRRAELRYKVDLVGYTACWDEYLRTRVWDGKIGMWRGPYLLNVAICNHITRKG